MNHTLTRMTEEDLKKRLISDKKRLDALEKRYRVIEKAMREIQRELHNRETAKRRKEIAKHVGKLVHIPKGFLVSGDTHCLEGRLGRLVKVNVKRALVDYGEDKGEWNIPWDWLALADSQETVSGTAGYIEFSLS